MDNAEANALLSAHLRGYRARPYRDLAALVREPESTELVGSSGARYQVEVLAVWDARPDGDLRVIGAIDNGGLRAFVPLSADFMVAPDGSFVGNAARPAGFGNLDLSD